MDARISCTTEIRDKLRRISETSGANYDEVLRWLLSQVGLDEIQDEMADRQAALKFLEEIAKFKAESEKAQ